MVGELRLAAAVHWYSRRLVSQECAARIASLDRTDFILALPESGLTLSRATSGRSNANWRMAEGVAWTRPHAAAPAW